MKDRDPALAAFQNWGKHNGWTQEELAYECDCNRSHISLVLSGARPGRFTWRRLVRILPEPGLLLLQQCSAWNRHATEALAKRRKREADMAEQQRDAAALQKLAAACRGEGAS